MKKIITILFVAPLILASLFLWYKYKKNVQSVVPYPYVFQNNAYSELNVEAPILIVGDRMGDRLGSFAKIMADKVSENLSKPVKIDSIAVKGEGLHRTLEKIKSLKRLPLIIVYMGGSEESAESKFQTQDIDTIKKNLEIYEDEKIQTLLMIFPQLSRFVYHTVKYKALGSSIIPDNNTYSDIAVQKRNEISFKLFEREINEFFTYAKDRNSYVIAVSTPLNLDAKPRSSCPGSFSGELSPKLDQVIGLVKERDFKQAYNISKELALMANNNARALYIHGKIAKNLGKIKEAQKYLELAIAFDCSNWRGSPVYNQILKSAASKHDVAFFDFNKMLKDHWTQNLVFFDDVYPQNLYMEKMAQVIAARIKKLLKL
ncbi:MAG: hypothetical protein WEB87_01730 [Bacteriovoracaceae bacterium]